MTSDQTPTKICASCHQGLPLASFSTRAGYKPGTRRLRSRCKTCERIDGRTRYWADPEKSRAQRYSQREIYTTEHKWRHELKYKYGLDSADYYRMLDEQQGVCAICHQPGEARADGSLVHLAVDHEHATGKIRQLLCSRCNLLLGRMGESPDRLRAAANYLERNEN